jgi:hypothetical protein
MPDMEKVMSWLEGLTEPDWRECYSDSEVQETARQALDLIDELLKEKEAVEPICQIIFDIPYYFCGSCKTMLNMYAVKAKYCSNCARRVKWK